MGCHDHCQPWQKIAITGQYYGSVTSRGLLQAKIEPTKLHTKIAKSSGAVCRCESNPALITSASVQWLDQWSSVSMGAIASAKMEEMLNESQDVRAALQVWGRAVWRCGEGSHPPRRG